MAERITNVKPVKIDYLCDDCYHPIRCKTGVGVGNSHGTKWTHQCPSCKKEYTFGYDVKYPRIEYLYIGEHE